MKSKIAMYMLLVILGTNLVFAAGGFGITPSVLQEEELVRGETYSRSLKVLSSEEEDREVTLEMHGDAVEWATLKYADSGEDITGSFTLPPNGGMDVLVEFAVPDDLPNDVYTGHFSVQPVLDENKLINQVSLEVRTTYSIKVTGEERRSGKVASITALDTESGQPIRIRYDFLNTGNVEFAPSAKLIIQKDGEVIDTVVREGELQSPDRNLVQIAEWLTEGHGTGNVTAFVSILIGQQQIAEDEVTVEVVPRGTFTANIIAGEAELPDELIAGKLVKGNVNFHNVGKIELLSKVQFEVFEDDELVDVISGEEKLVQPAESTELEFFYKPAEKGEYVLQGKLLYSGREQELEELTVTVVSEEDTAVNTEGFDDEDSSDGNMLMIVGGIVIALLVIVILFLVFRKK